MPDKTKEFPKFLHHENLEAVTVYGKAEEEAARAKGYVSEYIHKEFPKAVSHTEPATKTGEITAVNVVHSAPAELAEALPVAKKGTK